MFSFSCLLNTLVKDNEILILEIYLQSPAGSDDEDINIFNIEGDGGGKY